MVVPLSPATVDTRPVLTSTPFGAGPGQRVTHTIALSGTADVTTVRVTFTTTVDLQGMSVTVNQGRCEVTDPRTVGCDLRFSAAARITITGTLSGAPTGAVVQNWVDVHAGATQTSASNAYLVPTNGNARPSASRSAAAHRPGGSAVMLSVGAAALAGLAVGLAGVILRRRGRRRRAATYSRLTFCAAALAVLLVTVVETAHAGPAQAQPAGLLPSLPLPSLPLPSLPLPSLPLPSVSLPKVPLPAPSLSRIPLPLPTGGSPTPGSPAPRASGGTGSPPVDTVTPPGAAAAIIAANPAADLYPQPPVDPATTASAQQVATLLAVEHRIQYLNVILARTASDLARAQGQPDPIPQLIITLTTPAPALDRPVGSADVATGQILALSTALQSGQAELARRQDEVRVLQQAIADAERPIITVAAPVSTGRYAGGTLLWPVNGRITSGFGMRLDPYYHVWQLHPGVDIAVPIGTPIAAAAAGRVSQAGWYGGYGNYTCIDHGQVNGQRLSTCYGHQSRLLVSPGQLVRAGQVIGLSGSTGASTGPHLHFEVRLGGRPVDPLPWL